METQTIVRTEERRVAHAEARETVRHLLGEADVTRVTVSDTSGHALVEIPVHHEFAPLLMDAAASGAAAIADRVGDLVLEIEKQPGLGAGTPSAEGGKRQGRGEVRESMGAQGGGQQERPAGESQASDQQPANVTEEDIERIREANRVPTADADASRRIGREQGGNPDLKDTSTPYSPSQRRR